MFLDELPKFREGHTKRISSWDRTGRNRDCWTIEPWAKVEVAKIEGPGIIRHIWFTVSSQDPLYLRKTVLRMYWDGMDRPSVEAPLGDFFGVGHARASSYCCIVLSMSARDPGGEGRSPHVAMNCYFPMPFSDGARIEIENESDVPIRSFYFYIDYDELDKKPKDMARFHALWRRENPCRPPEHLTDPSDPTVNLSDRDNYLILEAEGRGHYVGTVLSVHNLYGGWWGEGDDMFMIDGEKWPPDMHGTGSEDYFGHAWGMQIENSFLYNGVSFHEGKEGGFNERITVYRFHIPDPIIFHKSIRVSIEHGHANDRCDDYSSVAYWYQDLPHKEFPPFPKVEERLPRPDATVYPVDLPIPPRRRASGSPIDPDKLGRQR